MAEVGPTHRASGALDEPQGESAFPVLASRRSPRRAAARRRGGFGVRTVRRAGRALGQTWQARLGGRGNSTARDTTEGFPTAPRPARKGRARDDLDPAGRRSRAGAERRRAREKLQRRSWNRRGGACGGDRGCQTSATCTAKAAPAHRARVVHPWWHREVLVLEMLCEGIVTCAEAPVASHWVVHASVEAGPSE